MFTKQLSIYLENQPGSLAQVLGLLAQHGIDLIALSIADTTDFGMLRIIVGAPEKTLDIVKQSGYTASLTDVLAVAVPDSPGGLAQALQLLQGHDISLEYIYSFVRQIDNAAIIILRVDKGEAAGQLLQENGYRLIVC